MPTTDLEKINWSSWYRGDPKVVNISVPSKPGVYQIRTDFKISRLNDASPIVSIGSAVPSLKARLYQRFHNTVQYLNRAEKWLVWAKHNLEFRYYVADSNSEAKYLECLLQLQYENQHWEIPPGNDRLELNPLKQRIKQVFGIPIDKLANELSKGLQSSTQVADALNIPPAILDNLRVYFTDHKTHATNAHE